MVSKLVRNNIPQIIEKQGRTPQIHIADDKEYKEKLSQKLKEECNEFLEGYNPEELADLLEVINAFCNMINKDIEKVEEIRKKKYAERGGFSKRVILDSIE